VAAPSFAADILPLFTAIDIAHMARGHVMLAEYAYMSKPANAQAVLDRLNGTGGAIMPPKPAEPWSPANIALFKAWIAGGYQP